MSLPIKEITDLLKNAPTATSLSGLSMMLVNSLGEFQTIIGSSFFTRNLGISDCNVFTSFGIASPTASAINTPVSPPNTSDIILYIGSSSLYGVQIYLPLHFKTAGIFARSIMKTWGSWVQLYTPTT